MNRTREGKAAEQMVLVCEHSPLALACARTIVEQMEILHPRLAVEIRAARASSVTRRTRRWAAHLFRALERNLAHAAVVPVENLPDDLPHGLEIAVVSERLAPFQALVSGSATLLDDLPGGSRIGVPDELTRFQLSGHRPDLNPVILRHPVRTGLGRVQRGQLDGLIAPVSELELLGWQDTVTEVLDGSLFLPSPGRGAVALVSLAGDRRSAKWLEPLDDLPSRCAVDAERALVRDMNGLDGCLGALAQVSGKGIHLEAALWSADGQEVVRDSLSGELDRGAELGRALAEKLCDLGGDRLVHRNRRSSRPPEKVSGASKVGD
jgi:hydroxymethylbilane synthase